MIVGMALSMHSGFNKGFVNYRKALDKQFNDNLVLTLEQYYEENGNWDELRDNKRLWRDLINESSVELLNDGHFRQPPPPRQHQRPPGNETKRKLNNKGRSHPNQRFRKQQLPPISLLDINKELLIGMRIRKDDKILFTPIKFNSKDVGYLGLSQSKNVHFKQDRIFANSIKNMLFKLGLLMILISIIITFPIANYFTRLVNKITQATKKVASGDFSTRIKTDRKDELGELVTNFNLLAKSLESNSESQKRIIADVAHELRTPISVIMGEIEAIQDGIHDANENTLNLLHSQISSLKNLVNDLYDLSESDLGSLKYKMLKVDINSLINQSYQNHQLRFEKKHISLHIDLPVKPCYVLGDSNRLNQLFNNILSNSVHYTDKGGVSEIKIQSTDNCIEIKISDSAPGLKPDQLEKIFDRLYRADKSRNKNTGGSGLGLSICKEIVNAHNGLINASISHLGGIEIFIQLPKIDG